MQPSLPDLPPIKPIGESNETIKPAAQGAASPTPSAPPPRDRAQIKGRLRQVVGYIGGASLGFVMLVAAGELTLKPGIRPSDILATIEARTDIGIFNQKMGATPGEFAITEDEYRSKLAEAERAGQAKAELAFQRDLTAVQADKERVVSAYQALYQRANMIAQAGVQMEAVAQQFRQRLIEQTNGGRVMVISIHDGLCAFGNADSCEAARQARAGMIEESTTLTEGDFTKKVRELMAGISDPASLVAGSDMQQNGAPAIQR